MRNKKRIKTPAKINLCLEVIEKLPSGFHKIRSVMLKLENIFDELEFEILPKDSTIQTKTDSAQVPDDERNLCFKAAKKFFEKTGESPGLRIKIKKKISVGAGLGGGSSNAAGVLLFLNNYFGKALPDKELLELASEIGKDVPFFLTQKRAALVKGMGEEIAGETDFSSKAKFLLVNPKIEVPTGPTYGKLRSSIWFMENKKRSDLSRRMFDLLISKKENWSDFLFNDFELVVEREFPIIKELKQALLAFGAQGALMSGSGSTVFGVFDDSSKLKIARQAIKEKYPGFYLLQG